MLSSGIFVAFKRDNGEVVNKEVDHSFLGNLFAMDRFITAVGTMDGRIYTDQGLPLAKVSFRPLRSQEKQLLCYIRLEDAELLP